MEKYVTQSGGISAAGLLGVILVILKVLGVISLSWVWVLAPFWIGLALFCIFLVFAVFITFLGYLAG